MFVTGLNPFLGVIAVLLSLVIGIPLVVFAFKKLVRNCKGKISFTPAVLFVLAFLILLSGDFMYTLFFGYSTLHIQIHDTYFVLANVHVMIFHALICLVFSAVYHFYPAITGRMLNAPLGYIHFVITLFGIGFISWPAHYESMAGMPRRYLDHSNWENLEPGENFNSFRMKVIILFIGAQLLFIVNLIYSAIRRKR